MNKNGKNKFYRTLNFDKDTKKLLREYNKLKEKMMKESEWENERNVE